MDHGVGLTVRAVLFDFNGTLSDDEHVLCELFIRLFAEHGRPLSAQEYFDQLAGFSDPEIVRSWLGRDHPDVEAVIEKRVARYRAAVADGSTVHEPVRDAVRYTAERVPVGIVSGAARAEIEPVLEAAGLAALFRPIVSSDDVAKGKPHPEGYLRALEQLAVPAEDVLVLEDTEAGVASAKAAGMRCVAVAGTLAPERLAAADELVERIDVELMRRLLQ
ncbi:MAG TPA: HAD family phosphatase [Gaiellaceae bacterium]|nr:HAD family phosphatase [Gaiellaceae bacterium]